MNNLCVYSLIIVFTILVDELSFAVRNPISPRLMFPPSSPCMCVTARIYLSQYMSVWYGFYHSTHNLPMNREVTLNAVEMSDRATTIFRLRRKNSFGLNLSLAPGGFSSTFIMFSDLSWAELSFSFALLSELLGLSASSRIYSER